MLYISDNLKYLRSRRKLSQQEAADGMKFGLDQYKKYEYGTNTPPAEALLAISRFYHISIDLLLTVNLQKIGIDNLLKLDDNRIVLPIAVDASGKNLIEIVPHKARAGYLSGYSDPEFIANLEQIALPFLGPGKHRAFPVGGDSMPPHDDKSYIVGRYVENLGEIKKDKTYILITHSEGITYKRLNRKNADSVIVEPDNVSYNPYEIRLSDILEIWEYVAHIGRNDSRSESHSPQNIENVILAMREDIKAMKLKVFES